ncbi:MAG: DsbC family protein [Deltaproteobacteria bacterium]
MLKLLYISLIASVLAVAYTPAEAREGCVGECASCHKLSTKEAEELLKKTGGTVKSIKTAPIKGMYELLMEKDGKQGLIFIDYAKKNLMQGFIVNFETLKKVSAHDEELQRNKQASHVDPKTIPVESAVVMGNPQGAKKLYVFTDPDCPYCRQLHLELKKLTKIQPDLAIFIMLYPLPIHPDAYDKSRAILTFKNQSTLDNAFNGITLLAVGTKDGSRELNEIMIFARRNGITATPSIVLPDGSVLSGFKSAEELNKLLGGTK